MTDSLWELNEMTGKIPNHTGGFLTGYDQREFTQEEVAARESCQNAMDAGRDTPGVTRVDFRMLRFSGKGKKELINRFKFNKLFDGRLEAIECEEKNKHFAIKIRELLAADSIQALLIRDYNTCGLGGAWNTYERQDHFARLVCAVNLDDKADVDDKSGGSFGLGKTAYAKSSAIRTVLYHSVFKPDARSGDTGRRLMATGIYPRHKFEDKNFGGFAFFGKPVSPDLSEAKPYEDGDAKDWWNFVASCANTEIGRSDNEYGTDILVLMPNLDLQLILRAIEDYYFPAIIESRLSVREIDEEGVVYNPNIYARKELEQFIRLMQDAKKAEPVRTDTKEVAALNRIKDTKLGVIAFEAAAPETRSSSRANCVALLRGTGMVINYVKIGSDAYEPAVGVFTADAEIHKFLVASENAAHSEWSEHKLKLEEHYPGIGREIVKGVNARVRSRFASFQKDLQPDVVTSKSESGLLSRLLSSALAGSKGASGPVKTFNNPVSLHLTRRERVGNHSQWRLQVHENEHTPRDPFDLEIVPSISLAGDSRMVPIKRMEFTVKDEKGKLLHKGDKAKLMVRFKPGMVLDYTVEFANPGQHNYVVGCKFTTLLGDNNAGS
jgi:hypothetical protein